MDFAHGSVFCFAGGRKEMKRFSWRECFLNMYYRKIFIYMKE